MILVGEKKKKVYFCFWLNYVVFVSSAWQFLSAKTAQLGDRSIRRLIMTWTVMCIFCEEIVDFSDSGC